MHWSFAGMPVFAGNGIGILDGGVPHYGFGGVLSLDEVKIGGTRVSWRRKDRTCAERFADGFLKV